MTFDEVDAANPSVWGLFVKFTFNRIELGHEHYSARAVLHRIRWETGDKIEDATSFKVNNNWSCYYARKFHQEHPAHGGFFRNRISKADAAFPFTPTPSTPPPWPPSPTSQPSPPEEPPNGIRTRPGSDSRRPFGTPQEDAPVVGRHGPDDVPVSGGSPGGARPPKVDPLMYWLARCPICGVNHEVAADALPLPETCRHPLHAPSSFREPGSLTWTLDGETAPALFTVRHAPPSVAEWPERDLCCELPDCEGRVLRGLPICRHHASMAPFSLVQETFKTLEGFDVVGDYGRARASLMRYVEAARQVIEE